MPRAKLAVVRFLILAVLLVGCGGHQRGASGQATRRRSNEGAITGLARDRDTAEPLGTAEVRAQRAGAPDVVSTAGRDGVYTLDHLPPGRYTVVGSYGGQKVTTTNIPVDPGEATYVDMSFTPGQLDALVLDWSDSSFTEIARFHPKNHSTLIGGTVSEASTHGRIAGAVVTAFGPTGAPTDETLQTVSGDDGRYRFDGVSPGVYVVSAYYSVSGRAQIEVRRADIHIESGEGVDVPLLIETTRAN